MNETVNLRTPLDIRIQRLRKCMIPSEEFSFWILRQACGVSAIKILRKNKHEKEETLLQHVGSRKFYKNPQKITIGDLAVLIASWYLDPECNEKDILLYFASFLSCVEGAMHRLVSPRRYNKKEGLNARNMDFMSEMMTVPFRDYMNKIMKLDIPSNVKEWCADYYDSCRFDKYTELGTILENLLGGLQVEGSRFNADYLLKMIPKGGCAHDLPTRTIAPVMNMLIIPMAFIAAETIEAAEE